MHALQRLVTKYCICMDHLYHHVKIREIPHFWGKPLKLIVKIRYTETTKIRDFDKTSPLNHTNILKYSYLTVKNSFRNYFCGL
jgi:hypothetical protein